MNDTAPRMSPPATEFRVRFVESAAETDTVLQRFRDPCTRSAVLLHGDEPGNESDLRITLLDATESVALAPDAAGAAIDESPALQAKFRGGEALWRPGHVLLRCAMDQGEGLLAAVVEFAFYERELRRIEADIAASWDCVEHDRLLAFQATAKELRQSKIIGERMSAAFARRIRFARIEPHLHTPDARLSAVGQKLGEALRETAGLESRAEYVDAQMEVAEHIYEMSSQRLGEFRASHGEHIMELIIIALLAAETLVMLAQSLWRGHP